MGLWDYCAVVSEIIGSKKVIDNATIVYDYWLNDKSAVECAEYIKTIISE